MPSDRAVAERAEARLERSRGTAFITMAMLGRGEEGEADSLDGEDEAHEDDRRAFAQERGERGGDEDDGDASAGERGARAVGERPAGWGDGGHQERADGERRPATCELY